MKWPVTVGWMVFIAVPLGLWALGAWANRGHGLASRVLGFVAGTDNRLSLSRLQAFVWTLVIFGSFAAAMSIHKDIQLASQAEIDAANKKAKAAADRATSKDTNYQAAQAELAAAETADKAAQDTLTIAKAEAAVLDQKLAASSQDSELKTKDKAAQDKLRDAEITLSGKEAMFGTKQKAVETAKAIATQAQADADKAQEAIPSSGWVQIPATLLALAAIAIGSGVFSSLISAVNDEQQTASITAIQVIKFGGGQGMTPLPQGPDVQPPLPGHANSLLIQGANFGTTKGTIRCEKSKFTKDQIRIIYWRDNQIAVDLADGDSYRKLTVDTSHGKLSYCLTGVHPNLILGKKVLDYEIADLFRDDKNPDTLSLMKFQMFGWTAIAIAIYVYLFLTHLSDHIETLPAIDSSIAILTGVSQAGYLGGKGVSNLSSK